MQASDRIRRNHGDDVAATRRLTADRDEARKVATTWGMPVVLFHNTTPGSLAACHLRIFSAGDPRNLESLTSGRLIVQYRTREGAAEALRAILRVAAADPDHDLAACVLAFAYDGTGARMPR